MSIIHNECNKMTFINDLFAIFSHPKINEGYGTSPNFNILIVIFFFVLANGQLVYKVCIKCRFCV